MIALRSAFAALALVGLTATAPAPVPERLPWRAAGLTEQQAAAHLLDRLTFGARPGEVERVVQTGLETWVEAQLTGTAAEPAVLTTKLKPLDALNLPLAEIRQTYPRPGQVAAMARRDGAMPGKAMQAMMSDTTRADTRARYRDQIAAYYRAHGFKPLRLLVGQLTAQKLLRATYGQNQLREVLTDFWFNHFNVSLTDNASRPMILPYERDAIRPNVLGSFRTLLGATAKHPAMLYYLDNAHSTAALGAPTTMDGQIARLESRPGLRGRAARRRIARGRQQMQAASERAEAVMDSLELPAELRPNRARGVNENYARELMELHTLGVDGGYTQTDVSEVARALTGWTVLPRGSYGANGSQIQRRIDRGKAVGFVTQGDFLFRADAHDSGPKTILGQPFPAGGGLDEGERVLDLVARHPATARHLARKLAVRFVSDEPPAALVDRLAATFTRTNGDLRATMRALIYSPEFWASRTQKIKSPLELTVSALRALDADIVRPRALIEWIERMGQPLYAYQAPTGYPDRATAWVNTGSLLNRMNFGLQLATGRVPGVRLDLLALNEHHEPESAEAALRIYAPKLLPERSLAGTVDRLLPAVHDPTFGQKLDHAAPTAPTPVATDDDEPTMMAERDADLAVRPDPSAERTRPTPGKAPGRRDRPGRAGADAPAPTALAQVVGLLLGSPEFQRH